MTGALRSASLYELAEMREILDHLLVEHDGVLTPELEAHLDALDGAATDKIERVALFVREQIARAEGIKVEEQRLTAKRQAHERTAESMKRYLQRQMERLGKTRVDGSLCTVALQKSQPSVQGALTQEQLRALWDHTEVDGSVLRVGVWRPFLLEIPEQYVLDKRRVLEAYKAGERLPDGVSVEQGAHVRIR